MSILDYMKTRLFYLGGTHVHHCCRSCIQVMLPPHYKEHVCSMLTISSSSESATTMAIGLINCKDSLYSQTKPGCLFWSVDFPSKSASEVPTDDRHLHQKCMHNQFGPYSFLTRIWLHSTPLCCFLTERHWLQPGGPLGAYGNSSIVLEKQLQFHVSICSMSNVTHTFVEFASEETRHTIVLARLVWPNVLAVWANVSVG